MDRELQDLSRRVRELERQEELRRWDRDREKWNRHMWHFAIIMWLATVAVYSIIFGLAFRIWR